MTPPSASATEPGTPTRGAVYIETYGCAYNQSDSEAMAGVLAAAGYDVVEASTQADLIILNTCTVKDRTYDRFTHRFETLRRAEQQTAGPKVLVAGCIPKANAGQALLRGTATLGPDEVGGVAAAADRLLGKKYSHANLGLSASETAPVTARPLLPTRRMRPHVEIIPLAAGCLSACTFCQTKLARGNLESFRPADLLRRVEQAAAEGVAEIWLTAQDAGAYGREIGEPLPALLRRMCAVPGDFRIRLGMTSPCWIHERLDEYLDLFADPKLFTFWHLPLQSGSDAVLRAMRRGNTAAQFMEIAERFHARFPAGALLTDLINGYPTETEADSEATLAVVRAAGCAGINRSNFSPRPGTRAARLPQLAPHIVKQRMARLTETAAQACHAWHAAWIGRSERVRVFEHKPAAAGVKITVAHNQSGRPVELAGAHPIGAWLDVFYHGAGDYHHLARPAQPGPGGQSAA